MDTSIDIKFAEISESIVAEFGFKNLKSFIRSHALLMLMSKMGHFSFEYSNAQSMKSLFVQMMLERGFLASNQYYAMYAHI
jgi:hypothetical protein